ncbi:hypothetical protein ES705_28334 [subsurface metagenome]
MPEEKLSIEAQISELENKIVAVCMRCPHVKWYTGFFECRTSRRHCHSARVRRWLEEIKKLEEGT